MMAAAFLSASALAAATSLLGRLSAPGEILVVGASGGTGGRAIRGLIDAGFAPQSLRILTRDPLKPAAAAAAALGCQIVAGDLEDVSTLSQAVKGCVGCYVHGTAGDTKKLDTGEVGRAENLAAAIAADGGVRRLVLNSYAAEPDCGVRRIEQKHKSEQVFASAGLHTVNLRANLFMEELWKKYTRPAILGGKYPFSTPPDRIIHLTCVRDMGRIAAACLAADTGNGSDGSGDGGGGETINVASDALTAPEMAAAFGLAQKREVVHKQNRLLYWSAKLLLPDLYEVMRFYRTTKEKTNVDELRQRFPGMLTPLSEFLEETKWADETRMYEDLIGDA